MEEKKFYQKGWFTILLLILFWPAGLIVMWCNNVFSKNVRIIITILSALFVIFYVADNRSDSTTANTATVNETNQSADSQVSATSVSEVTSAAQQNTSPSVPKEYTSALRSAQTYSDSFYMSKKAIYKQLTSAYDKFSPEAAQYAVDNVKADWNKNALASAETYQSDFAMSPEAIRDQLTSAYDGFTEEEANYAISNLSK